MREKLFDFLRYGLSIFLAVLGTFLPIGETLKLIMFIAAALISGYTVLIESVEKLLKGEFLDENTLMIIASVVAFVLGEYFEGVLILVLFGLGETLEDIASDRARDKITALSKLKEKKVRLADGRTLDPEDVEIGALIEVRKGERVAIDGILVSGDAELDLKAITGESKIYELSEGAEVYGGAINYGDAIVIKTTKLYKDSTVERIVAMVEGANAKKAKSQKFITKFAKIYTPIVVFLAVIIAFLPTLVFKANLSEYVYKALSFLIIACPCALVISVPLGFFVGIGALSKHGILVKGSSVLDKLDLIKAVAFDKTGTLTKGELSVDRVESLSDASEDYLLLLAASLEKFSNHPVSSAIVEHCKGKELLSVKNVKEIGGRGLVGIIDGKEVKVGNGKLVDRDEVPDGTVVFVALDGNVLGRITLSDTVKPEAKRAIEDLYKTGVDKTYIVSGDSRSVAEKVGEKLGISEVFAELLPDKKVEAIGVIKKNTQGKVAFVGDGINDSPSLAFSDVGIAMGAIGSEVSIETADAVILNDDLNSVPRMKKHAGKVKRIVITNIVGSISVKVAIMILAFIVKLPVWISAFADVGVMLLAILNSLRAARIK